MSEPPRILAALALFGASTACATSGVAFEESARRHVRLLGGVRSLGSEWEPVEDHATFGAELDVRMDAGGLGLELGVLRSVEESEGSEARLTEYFAGARKTFAHGTSRWRPHVAGGLSLADYLFDDGSRRKDGYLFAFYVRAGARFAMSRSWHLSADVRVGFGEFGSLFDREQDLGGYQFLAGVGYSF